MAEAEERLIEVMRRVAAEAFRRGVQEARDQDRSLDALDAALNLPPGLAPVPVDVTACGYNATARVIPGSAASAAEALESVIITLDLCETKGDADGA